MKRRLYQLTVIVVSLFVIHGFSRSLIELWGQKQRLKRAKDQLTKLEQQEVELKRQLKYYQSDEYVEQIARDKLLLRKEGETVILFPDQNDNNPISTNKPINTNDSQIDKNLPNWKKWAQLFGFYK